MKMFRSMRFLLLALLLAVIPASSYAGVFISVGFAPPALPVYVQPPCPQPGLMWTPGYWAYGPNGYFWVPGTWVPAPYVGALWTPGYWGFGGGLYAWHPGYWGPHVGYYGGVNYGFGYMGIGFVGGTWRGGVFAYNSAVMHVGAGGAWNNRVYNDRTVVVRNTIVNDRRVAYSGGPGGINHAPTAEENRYANDRRTAPTSFQTQHETTARADGNSYASRNGGRPTNLAVARPMGANNRAIGSQSSGAGAGKVATHDMNTSRPQAGRPMQQERPAAQPRSEPQSRPAPQQRGGGEQQHNEGGRERGH